MRIEKTPTPINDVWLIRLTRQEALAAIAKLSSQLNDPTVGSETLVNEFDGCEVDLRIEGDRA